jgi:predicted site-specific integrase-resolvase
MGQEWVTRAVACQVKGVSDRTLRRWINEGKIQAKREGNRLFVLVDTADTAIIEQVKRENELLRQQLTEKDQQISQQQTIIISLSI